MLNAKKYCYHDGKNKPLDKKPFEKKENPPKAKTEEENVAFEEKFGPDPDISILSLERGELAIKGNSIKTSVP